MTQDSRQLIRHSAIWRGGRAVMQRLAKPSPSDRRAGSIPAPSAFWFPDGKHRLPNMTYGWRLPVQRLAWMLAWWLMRRVVLGWMTPQGQARVIHEALGWYRPHSGGLYVSTGASNTTTCWNSDA
jgi:hypothetical protein